VKRYGTFNPLDEIGSAFLNYLQDVAYGLLRATSGFGNDFPTTVKGAQTVLFQSVVILPTAEPYELSSDVDWRDRLVEGTAWKLAAAGRVGQSLDYQLNDIAAGPPAFMFQGYTGSGAVSNLATGADVGVGAAPLNGAGAFRSYALTALNLGGGSVVYLYADPATGVLNAYNSTGATVHLLLKVTGTGDLGMR